METVESYKICIEIDKLTNSIENAISGDRFATEVLLFGNSDLKTVTKTKGWLFNWSAEYKLPEREIYKLTIRDNPKIIQGLVSVSDYSDHYYFI